jgi:hypothetical protein
MTDQERYEAAGAGSRRDGWKDALLATGAATGLVFWEAFVLWKLYSWHAVPSLGAPALGYGSALGLLLIWSVLMPFVPNKQRRDTPVSWCYVVALSEAGCLVIGWWVR